MAESEAVVDQQQQMEQEPSVTPADAPSGEAEQSLTHTRTAAFPVEQPPDGTAGPQTTEPEAAAVAKPGEVKAAATAPSWETDAELSAASAQALVLESAMQKKRDTRNKPVSLMGSNLASKRVVQATKPPATSPSGFKARATVDRYAAEVRQADQNRKIGYLPMEEQIKYKPASLDVANDLRAELQDFTKTVGGAHLVSESGAGWDKIFGNDKFQKRMQYLHEHARTGTFTEKYGEDGKYEGEFLHGMRHGKGKYEFRDESYDGEWKWDHRHGEGEMKCSDGTTLKGHWQNGKLNGYATVLDIKGNVVYEGEFKDGKRHGLGRQVFESGDMYDGGWHQGRLHDRGVYYFVNGDRLYGMWNQGAYDGVGVFHYHDGSISRREYRNGLLMTVQDFDHETQRFGKTITRGGMQKHTRDRDFPKEVFLLSSS